MDDKSLGSESDSDSRSTSGYHDRFTSYSISGTPDTAPVDFENVYQRFSASLKDLKLPHSATERLGDGHKLSLGSRDSTSVDEATTASQSEQISQDPNAQEFRKQIESAWKLTRDTLEFEDERKAEEFKRFVDDNTKSWNNLTSGDSCFLHFLARDRPDRGNDINLKWLMERAIREWPQLMGCMNKWDRSPLAEALESGNLLFIYTACKEEDPQTLEYMRGALELECRDFIKKTSLHLALHCRFKSEEAREAVVKAMCELVPEEMLAKRDSDGRTPLHIAVEFERCQTQTQIGIVMALLKRRPAALDEEYDHEGLRFSVYQYHERSRRLYELAQKAQEQKRRSSKGGNSESRSEEKEEAKPDSSGTGPGPLVVLQRIAEAEDQSVNLSSARPQREDQESVADSISEILKLEYLRRKESDELIHCLQLSGENSTGKEFWFDFGQCKTLSREDFHARFNHIQLYPLLKYVSFPNLKWTETKTVPGPRGRKKPAPKKTLKGMEIAFQWLRDKGVRRILNVVVEDFEPPSHSDEALEGALKDFGVEELDWRRLDIDPASLKKIGGCLRKVHLNWSGQNVVLRAWSGKDGLSTIPTLEKIQIRYEKGHDSKERTEENIEAFKTRLKESWPTDPSSLTVEFFLSTGTFYQHPGLQPDDDCAEQSKRSSTVEKWLKCMDTFSDQFCQIEPEKLICFSSLQIPPVKVALIDDGVDFSGIKTMNRLLGRSFYYEGEGGTGKTRPYWNSTIGHGTLMARMILRICPAAVIHVIRLRSFVAKGSDSVQIDQHSAVNAIKYASELPDVQIISMSWTMPAPKMQGLKKVFDDAMALAAKKNILVFCAANDQGFHQDSTYPHSSNRSRFRIGAATPEGKGTDAVGNTEKIDYLLPGHNIPVDEPSPQHRQGSPVPEAIGTSSGSSIATALAAGLAALLLECVRLGILYTKETDSEPADRPFVIREDDWRRLRQRDGMREAFSNIGTSADSGNKYVEVERLFQDNAERLEDVRGDPINMLRVVAGIAGKLLGKAPQRSAHGDGSCVS